MWGGECVKEDPHVLFYILVNVLPIQNIKLKIDVHQQLLSIIVGTRVIEWS